MQIDLDLIPQFEALAEGAVGQLVTQPSGIVEFMFFFATYIWERTGGEGGTAISGLF